MSAWTDNISVIAAASLTRGNTTRGTIDLRTKVGAMIFIKFGRGGTAALSAGARALIRRVLNNDSGVGSVHPVHITLNPAVTVAANSTTVAVDSASGQAVVNLTSVTGFAAGDLVCIQDAGGGFTRLEWQRVAKINASTLVLDRNLTFSHTSVQADTVRNKGEIFVPQWVDGGSLVEVILDYSGDTTGDPLQVQVLAQSYDS